MITAPLDTCVFLLGAGSSYANNKTQLPLMRGFIAQAKKNHQEHADGALGTEHRDYHLEFEGRYRSVLDLASRLRDSCQPPIPLRSCWDDLEVLFTHAEFQRTLRQPHSLQILNDFTWVVWDMYCRFNEQPPFGKVCDALLSKDCFPVFITTNYDLLPEWDLWTYMMESGSAGVGGKYGRFYYPGFQNFQSANSPIIRFDPDRDNRFLRQLEQPRNANGLWEIPIIKLHGSASWFEIEGGEWIGASKFFGRDRFLVNEFRRDVCHVAGREIVKPAIIPPLLSKGAPHDVIRLQWKAAVHHLKSAKFVVSVGYSFPSTDAFMHRLLTEGLMNNNSLERFAIVDVPLKAKKNEARKMRYAEVFDRCDDRVWMYELNDGAENAFHRLSNDPVAFLEHDTNADGTESSCVLMRDYVRTSEQ